MTSSLSTAPGNCFLSANFNTTENAWKQHFTDTSLQITQTWAHFTTPWRFATVLLKRANFHKGLKISQRSEKAASLLAGLERSSVPNTLKTEGSCILGKAQHAGSRWELLCSLHREWPAWCPRRDGFTVTGTAGKDTARPAQLQGYGKGASGEPQSQGRGG